MNSSMRSSPPSMRPSIDTFGSSIRPSIDTLGSGSGVRLSFRPSIDTVGSEALSAVTASPGKGSPKAVASGEPITISMGNLEISLTPKKANRESTKTAESGLKMPAAGEKSDTNATTRGTNTSPSPRFVDASVQTEDVDGLVGKEVEVQTLVNIPKELAEAKQFLQTNLAAIAEKVEERNRIDAEILKRTAENDECTRWFVSETKKEKKKREKKEQELEDLNSELIEWRYNTGMLKFKAANVFESMAVFQESLEEFASKPKVEENDE